MRHFLCLLIVLTVSGAPAAANMFTVSGIEIAASGESAVEAKAIAIAEGQAKAFAQLVRRLTSPEDAAFVPAANPATLQSLVAGYSLDNERTTATDYLADLTVRFNGDAIEFLLSRSDVRIAVEQAPPALIIPILWTEGSTVIWGGENSWRTVWERIDLDNRLVPALLPLGDAADELIDAQALVTADPAALELLAGRYGVDLALVALVAFDFEQNRIEAALAGSGPRGPVDIREIGEIKVGQEAEAMAVVADRLLVRLDQEWRAAVAADPTRQARQSVAIGVPFGNLQEWVGIRGRIETAPGVDNVDVRALSAGQAQIIVTYSGGFRELASAFQIQGLFLYDDGTNWIIRTN